MVQQLFHSNNELFSIFSATHILILIGVLTLLLLMIIKKEMFKNTKVTFFIRSALIISIIIQQLLLYGWYVTNNALHFADALPLYPCRLVSLLLVVQLVKMNKNLFHLVFYWGIIGATLALFSPDTNNLGFPNAMFIQFILGHSVILISVCFLAILYDYKPTKSGLLFCYRYSSIYFGAIIVINALFGSNYAYLKELPPVGFLGGLPSYPYHIPLVIVTIYLLFYSINLYFWIIEKYLNKRTQSV